MGKGDRAVKLSGAMVTAAGHLVDVSAVAVPDFGSTPVNAQERFLNRFEPDGESFINRATPHSPGVSVTADDRARMVALDDDRGGIATILYVTTLPLAAAVGAGPSTIPVTSPWAQAMSSSMLGRRKGAERIEPL